MRQNGYATSHLSSRRHRRLCGGLGTRTDQANPKQTALTHCAIIFPAVEPQTDCPRRSGDRPDAAAPAVLRFQRADIALPAENSAVPSARASPNAPSGHRPEFPSPLVNADRFPAKRSLAARFSFGAFAKILSSEVSLMSPWFGTPGRGSP
jgi:hypothetical protein